MVTVSFSILLVIGCNGRLPDERDSAGVPKSGPSSRVEPVKSPTPMLEESIGEASQPVSEQSDQAQQETPTEEKSTSRVPPEGIPNEKERDAILDKVNLGPGPPGKQGSEAPMPPVHGTESGKGKMQGAD